MGELAPAIVLAAVAGFLGTSWGLLADDVQLVALLVALLVVLLVVRRHVRPRGAPRPE